MLFVLSAWVLSEVSAAQDGLYHLDQVDYFSMKTGAGISMSGSLRQQETDRHEFAVVTDLLEDPNEENALRYIAWSRDRTARLMRARELVERLEQADPVRRR